MFKTCTKLLKEWEFQRIKSAFFLLVVVDRGKQIFVSLSELVYMSISRLDSRECLSKKRKCSLKLSVVIGKMAQGR